MDQASNVTVSSYYFAGKSLRAFPRTIEHQGRAVTFVEGLQLLVQKGTSWVRQYEMEAEGGNTYRLLHDGQNWTMVGGSL